MAGRPASNLRARCARSRSAPLTCEKSPRDCPTAMPVATPIIVSARSRRSKITRWRRTRRSPCPGNERDEFGCLDPQPARDVRRRPFGDNWQLANSSRPVREYVFEGHRGLANGYCRRLIVSAAENSGDRDSSIREDRLLQIPNVTELNGKPGGPATARAGLARSQAIHCMVRQCDRRQAIEGWNQQRHAKHNCERYCNQDRVLFRERQHVDLHQPMPHGTPAEARRRDRRDAKRQSSFSVRRDSGTP